LPRDQEGRALIKQVKRQSIPSSRRGKAGKLHRLRPPATRPLKAYAFDPSRGRHLGNVMTLAVPYEPLARGPTGYRVAVVDYDATNKCFYDPVDLEDRLILLRDGLDPSESDPHFHQQMVYAVVMDTVQSFDEALGRRIHWRRGERGVQSAREAAVDDIWRLRLYPHAMAEANAYYSPRAHGILFGYFRASESDPGQNLPGQTVFTCLSHDIIAHETTHAVIDGIRSHFTYATNIDVPAFHEAFADLVALFRHFSHKEVLLDAIQKTGGRLWQTYLAPAAAVVATPGAAAGPAAVSIQAQIAQRNPLIDLARQFGDATGRNAGLRSALGTPPDPRDYLEKQEPHERGSVLVSAVFDAYLTTYLKRTSALFQLYRAGGGVVEADVPAPLADLLAGEASGTADRFFKICARALDYCPPVDITFGDYLRAVITAHTETEPDDEDGVRDAFMRAFRLRGIVPEDAPFFSEDALSWPVREERELPPVERLVFGDPNVFTAHENDVNGKLLRSYANRNARALGFDPGPRIDATTFHPLFRVRSDGRLGIDMVVELVQVRELPFDASTPALGTFPFYGGATLIIPKPHTPHRRGTPRPAHIRYLITKHTTGPEGDRRAARSRLFHERSGLLEGGSSGTRRLLASDGRSQPSGTDRFKIDFALMHSGL
jgi:hypothetical protein